LSVDAGHVECSVSTGTSTLVQIYRNVQTIHIQQAHNRCNYNYNVTKLPWILLMQTVWTFWYIFGYWGGGLRTLAYSPVLHTWLKRTT